MEGHGALTLRQAQDERVEGVLCKGLRGKGSLVRGLGGQCKGALI